jgi:Arc/MetJ-type ribon-helix-helix transcriptional regulator
MEPITLLLPRELLEELDDEADEAGFSSRSEYIRHLLLHRDGPKAGPPAGLDEALSDVQISGDSIESVEDLAAQLSAMDNRITALEEEVDTLRSGVSNQATEESQGMGSEDEGRGDSADSSTQEEHTHGEHGERDEEQFPNLKEWLRKNGPQSEAAQAIMIDAAQILTEEGPLSASDLKERLFTQQPDAYSSANALWEATIRRGSCLI